MDNTISKSDLRSFLDDVRRFQEPGRVSGPVNVQTQIGTLCCQANTPVIFENLEGYPDFSLVDGLTRIRETQAIALGLPAETPPGGVIPGYVARIAQGPGILIDVDHSPAQEKVYMGDAARLSDLPIPTPSQSVDIPHLNVKSGDFDTPCISSGIGFTKDPETGLLNSFFTMAKVIGDQKIQFFMLPGHTERNVNAWAARGERCPMALVIGCHPAIEMSALFSGDHDGFSEIALASHFIGGAIPMVDCKTIDLKVPAMAEIIIEGYIDAQKGPYLHLAGHSDTNAPIISMEPFFDVSAITTRDKPIYRHIQPTRFTEHHSYAEFIMGPPIFMMLSQAGLDIHDVRMPLRSGANCLVVQMTAHEAGDAEKARAVIEALPMKPRMTVMVDKDIDIYNTDDVLYALAIRTDPGCNLAIIAKQMGLPEPLNTIIDGPQDIEIIPHNCWVVDALMPSLDQPDRRLEFKRNEAKGEGQFKLEDFLD